jgi:diacylglycerol kinase family enzyme
LTDICTRNGKKKNHLSDQPHLRDAWQTVAEGSDHQTNAAGSGIEFSILPTDAAGNYSFLIPVIEKDGVTDVVICGGDGTVSAVAAALKGRDVRIGIIPMGSGNGLAFAAGIPQRSLG